MDSDTNVVICVVGTMLHVMIMLDARLAILYNKEIIERLINSTGNTNGITVLKDENKLREL